MRRVRLRNLIPRGGRWVYRGRTDTWCLDLKWWKITVYNDKEGWKYLWMHNSDPYKTREAAQEAAEAEVVLKFADIEKRMRELGLIATRV